MGYAKALGLEPSTVDCREQPHHQLAACQRVHLSNSSSGSPHQQWQSFYLLFRIPRMGDEPKDEITQ